MPDLPQRYANNHRRRVQAKNALSALKKFWNKVHTNRGPVKGRHPKEHFIHIKEV
jgi:hypothetical protein